MTEKLINHIGIVQMDGAYFTPSMEEMFDAYKKSIPDLLIDQTQKQELKIKQLEGEKSELEEIKENNQLQKDEVARQGQAIENLIQELNELKKK